MTASDTSVWQMIGKTVLISGLRVAGPTLAFWLRAAGFRPTLIEHAPALRSGGYVIDFWDLGYDIAERMEVGDELNRTGYHIREMRIVNRGGKRVAGFGTSVFLELTGGRFVTIARSALSRVLSGKIADSVEMIFGHEIRNLRELDDCVEVELKHGGTRNFDLVVGADGLHSKVRRLVFGQQGQFEKRLGYMVAAFETIAYRPRDDDVYVMFSDPGRMVGRVTLRDDRTLILFVFTADDAALGSLPDLSGQKDCVHGLAITCGSAREFLMLSTVRTLFTSIVSARSECQDGRKEGSRLSATLPIACPSLQDKARPWQ